MTNIYKSAEGERAIRERYQKFLNYWPVPNQQLRVPTRQGETFIVASGAEGAPPLLLLHGSSANSTIWMRYITSWAPHFRVYAVDIIGEPGFSAPARPPLDSDAHALWLDDVMQALSLPRASILGGSFGGWLAADYATRFPDKVENLVLICPGGIGRGKIGILIKATILRMAGPWGLRRLKEMILGCTPADAPPPVRAFWEFMALIFENFRPRMQRLPTISDAALRRLTMPVLAIVGAKDALLDSAETKRRLEQLVPRAEVRYLPDAGHYISGQAEPIQEFLRLTEASTTG